MVSCLAKILLGDSLFSLSNRKHCTYPDPNCWTNFSQPFERPPPPQGKKKIERKIKLTQRNSLPKAAITQVTKVAWYPVWSGTQDSGDSIVDPLTKCFVTQNGMTKIILMHYESSKNSKHSSKLKDYKKIKIHWQLVERSNRTGPTYHWSK